jgi:hypothetical protein
VVTLTRKAVIDTSMTSALEGSQTSQGGIAEPEQVAEPSVKEAVIPTLPTSDTSRESVMVGLLAANAGSDVTAVAPTTTALPTPSFFNASRRFMSAPRRVPEVSLQTIPLSVKNTASLNRV